LHKKLRSISSLPAPVRILLFLLVLVICWAPFAGVIYGYFHTARDMTDPGVLNLLNILVNGGLGGMFIIMLPWWNQAVYGRHQPFSFFGLVGNQRNFLGFLQGWGMGFSSLLLLYFIQGLLGLLEWQPVTIPLGQLLGGGLLSSVGVGFIEELVFRGWILTELEADYSLSVSLWSTALFFAATHFIKPVSTMLAMFPQFPGLTVLGLLLVWAKRSQQNLLGVSIGLHAGIIGVVYLMDVGKMVKYTNRLPDWITGAGTPAAGLMGIIGLLSLASFFALQNRSLRLRGDR
jgi:uncharacterized protein